MLPMEALRGAGGIPVGPSACASTAVGTLLQFYPAPAVSG
jgi:hypothetical protein